MVLEATMIALDNSEAMRNGDYAPTRFQAQADAINILCGAKTQVCGRARARARVDPRARSPRARRARGAGTGCNAVGARPMGRTRAHAR